MESFYDKESRSFVFKGKYAIPADDKIVGVGDRAFINEENIFTVRNISMSVINSPSFHGMMASIFPDVVKTKMDAYMYLLTDVCRYYYSPEMPYDELKSAFLENMMYFDKESPLYIHKNK